MKGDRPSIAELRVVTKRDKWLQITPLLPPSSSAPLLQLHVVVSLAQLVMTKSMSISRLRLHLVVSLLRSVIARQEIAPDGVVMGS